MEVSRVDHREGQIDTRLAGIEDVHVAAQSAECRTELGTRRAAAPAAMATGPRFRGRPAGLAGPAKAAARECRPRPDDGYQEHQQLRDELSHGCSALFSIRRAWSPGSITKSESRASDHTPGNTGGV